MKRQTSLLALLMLWILVILGGYYYYHKPISFPMLVGPLHALIDIFFAGLFAGLAGGVGRRLLRAESIPSLERVALQYGLGAGVLSLTWLIFGGLGWYHLPLAWPLLLIGVVILWRDARAWYTALDGIPLLWRRAKPLEKSLALLAAALLIGQLFVALAPPLKWDALAYHLQLPRQYLAAGKLIFVPENPYWGHPELVEMLNTFAMAAHRVETAAVLGWLSGIIFLVGLLGITETWLARLAERAGRPVGNSAAGGWMAITAVLTGYTFRGLLGWSYTDLYSALFGLCAMVVFFAWLETQRPAWLVWAGLFCGFALGTKWTAGVLLLGILLCARVFRKQGSLRFTTWLLAGLAAFLAIFPWLLKNLLATGSPIYPYFFATPWIDAARIASANPRPETFEWWQHLLFPFASTIAGVDSAPGYGADLGPLLLLFAIPGLWHYRHSAIAKSLSIILLLTGFTMATASLQNGHLMQTRVYFAVLPALALASGWGWEWLQSEVLAGVRLRRIVGAVALLVMVLAVWQDTFWMGDVTPARFTLGTQTETAYLENTLGYHIRAARRIEALPTTSKTLLLWEPRGLYFPLNIQADLWIDRWRTDRRELGSAAAILARWKAEGFTHVLVYQPGVEVIRPRPGQTPDADWAVFQDLLAKLPSAETIGDTYSLYALP